MSEPIQSTPATGELNNTLTAAEFQRMLDNALRPLTERIADIERNLAALATKNYVDEQISPIRSDVAQARAAAKAASADVIDIQSRIEVFELSIQRTVQQAVENLDSSSDNLKETLARYDGQMTEIAKRREERFTSIEKAAENRADIIQGQGRMIGELNEKMARHDERIKNYEDDVQKIAASVEPVKELMAKLDRIEAEIAKPGIVKATAIRAKDVMAKNPKLALLTIGLVALAIIAVVAPELVPGLYKLLIGAQ